MENDLAKKQRIRFFLMNLVTFALIFIALGVIMFQMINHYTYQETDRTLMDTSQNNQVIQREIDRLLGVKNAAMAPDPNRGINHFNMQIILWSKSGKMLNQDNTDGRIEDLSHLKLKKKNLNEIAPLTLKSKEDEALYFHTLTIEIPDDLNVAADSKVAYIQFLSNTNQVSQTMNMFKIGLVICMVFFWLLSLAISYYLSKITMKPILHSWRKQQEFVENASHELRTPLAIIQNLLQGLFTKPNHTILEESEAIAQALNETRRLTTLTSDLLTIARSDSNQLTLEKKPLVLTEFLTSTIQPFEEIARSQAKEFVFDNQITGQITADEKRLHQLLVILLDNALKYTTKGDKINVISKKSNHDWVLEVSNTGPTISPEAKQHLFDRFYREDKSRNKATGGYGLGLAIAAQIVAEHQGKLQVLDNQPQGAIFQIKLPLK